MLTAVLLLGLACLPSSRGFTPCTFTPATAAATSPRISTTRVSVPPAWAVQEVDEPGTAGPVSEGVVTISYCARCNWMLRATWMAQEVLSTFRRPNAKQPQTPEASAGLGEQVQVEGCRAAYVTEVRLIPRFGDPGGAVWDVGVCAMSLLSLLLSELRSITQAVIMGVGVRTGDYVIEVDGVTVWDRKVDGGFPEAKVVKRKIRDVLIPALDLGHCDR